MYQFWQKCKTPQRNPCNNSNKSTIWATFNKCIYSVTDKTRQWSDLGPIATTDRWLQTRTMDLVDNECIRDVMAGNSNSSGTDRCDRRLLLCDLSSPNCGCKQQGIVALDQLRFDFSNILANGRQVAELTVLLQSYACKYFKFDFIGWSWNLRCLFWAIARKRQNLSVLPQNS